MKNIEETRNYFIKEIDQNELISSSMFKRHPVQRFFLIFFRKIKIEIRSKIFFIIIFYSFNKFLKDFFYN